MAGPSDQQYTTNHRIGDDGAMRFDCSTDVARWPYLALDPLDPILVQSVQFWASVEIGAARGTLDRSKWTAITWIDWRCGGDIAGLPVRGVSELIPKDGKEQFGLKFYDDHDRLVFGLRGQGVVFQNRDFDAWRAQAKQALPQDKTDSFPFASAAILGCENRGLPFLNPLQQEGATPYAEALVTKENGFLPTNRFITGSGDHVNSTHLAEVARQFVSQWKEGRPFAVTAGEMRFTRYVELGSPHRIALLNHQGDVFRMAVSQAGRPCTEVMLTCRDL